MKEKNKKVVMWISLFMIAFPMPLIIYFGLKFVKPPPFKSDCAKISHNQMTEEHKARCRQSFNPAEVVPNPLKILPFF